MSSNDSISEGGNAFIPDMHSSNYENYTPLFQAIEKGDWDLATTHLQTTKSDACKWTIKKAYDDEVTFQRLPLHQACLVPPSSSPPPLTFLSFLLQSNPNATSSKDVNGRIPLHYAASSVLSGFIPKEFIQELINSDPKSVDVVDEFEKTPFQCLLGRMGMAGITGSGGCGGYLSVDDKEQEYNAVLTLLTPTHDFDASTASTVSTNNDQQLQVEEVVEEPQEEGIIRKMSSLSLSSHPERISTENQKDQVIISEQGDVDVAITEFVEDTGNTSPPKEVDVTTTQQVVPIITTKKIQYNENPTTKTEENVEKKESTPLTKAYSNAFHQDSQSLVLDVTPLYQHILNFSQADSVRGPIRTLGTLTSTAAVVAATTTTPEVSIVHTTHPWNTLLAHIEQHPQEASIWNTSRDANGDYNWKRLPLHQFCIQYSSFPTDIIPAEIINANYAAVSSSMSSTSSDAMIQVVDTMANEDTLPIQILKALIQANPYAVETPDLNQRLPLHHAAVNGAPIDVLKILIQESSLSSIQALDAFDKTPLCCFQSQSLTDLTRRYTPKEEQQIIQWLSPPSTTMTKNGIATTIPYHPLRTSFVEQEKQWKKYTQRQLQQLQTILTKQHEQEMKSSLQILEGQLNDSKRQAKMYLEQMSQVKEQMKVSFEQQQDQEQFHSSSYQTLAKEYQGLIQSLQQVKEELERTKEKKHVLGGDYEKVSKREQKKERNEVYEPEEGHFETIKLEEEDSPTRNVQWELDQAKHNLRAVQNELVKSQEFAKEWFAELKQVQGQNAILAKQLAEEQEQSRLLKSQEEELKQLRQDCELYRRQLQMMGKSQLPTLPKPVVRPSISYASIEQKNAFDKRDYSSFDKEDSDGDHDDESVQGSTVDIIEVQESISLSPRTMPKTTIVMSASLMSSNMHFSDPFDTREDDEEKESDTVEQGHNYEDGENRDVSDGEGKDDNGKEISQAMSKNAREFGEYKAPVGNSSEAVHARKSLEKLREELSSREAELNASLLKARLSAPFV